MTRYFGEKRITGAVFLDVAKVFDFVWVDGLLYKLTVLNFPSYLVKTITAVTECYDSKLASEGNSLVGQIGTSYADRFLTQAP